MGINKCILLRKIYRGFENIKKHKQLQRSTLHAVMTSQSAQKRVVKLGKLTPLLRCMT